jgi:hypothetical protein
MLRRTFCCALTIALALMLGQVSPAAAQARPSVPTTTQAGWRLEVRKPGTTAWNMSGKYAREDSARSAAVNLYKAGFQVRVTKYESVTFRRPTSTDPPPSSVRPPETTPVAIPQPIGWAQAKQLFSQLLAMGDRIAFRFPTDGCYARAHLMAQEMRRQGLQPWKVWSKANGKEPLFATTKNHPRGHVTWSWHVAPILRVTLNSGKVIWCVFDPSLWMRPCSIREWLKVQTRSGATVKPICEITSPGRAPLWQGKRMGSGYTISNSIPVDRLDEVALARMRQYKPYEGKWHPKLDKDAPAWVKTPVAIGGSSAPGTPSKPLGGMGRPSSPPSVAELLSGARPGPRSAFDSLPPASGVR